MISLVELDNRYEHRNGEKFKIKVFAKDFKKLYRSTNIRKQEKECIESETHDFADTDQCMICTLGNHVISAKVQVDESFFLDLQTKPARLLIAKQNISKDELVVSMPAAGYKKLDDVDEPNWKLASVDGNKVFYPTPWKGNGTSHGSMFKSTAEKTEANMRIVRESTKVTVNRVSYTVEVPYLINFKAIKEGAAIVVHDPDKKTKKRTAAGAGLDGASADAD